MGSEKKPKPLNDYFPITKLCLNCHKPFLKIAAAFFLCPKCRKRSSKFAAVPEGTGGFRKGSNGTHSKE